MDKNLLDKYEGLKEHLAAFGSVAIAFSSGVDSTFLLYAAKEALGDKVIAVTASSCLFPERELQEAKEYCDRMGVGHFVIQSEELEIKGFAHNPRNRCYLCKRELLKKIGSLAREQGCREVAEGSNLDDNGDYRPGLLAVEEMGIKSPLRELGFTKREIRELSRYFDIPTWDKQSFACLASRFPYGELINNQKLKMVERAEQLLLDLGFHQLRVRIHGEMARIELLPEEFPKFMEETTRLRVYKKLKEYGFSYISLDILGYRTGSMNEVLEKNPK